MTTSTIKLRVSIYKAPTLRLLEESRSSEPSYYLWCVSDCVLDWYSLILPVQKRSPALQALSLQAQHHRAS